MLEGGHEEHGVHVGRQLAVGEGQLELEFEVADGAQPADDEGRPDVLGEAQRLFEAGVKELLIVSQDTSAYGVDVQYRMGFWDGKPVKTRMLDLCERLGELATKMNEVTGEGAIDAAVLEREIGRYDDAIARGKGLFNDDQLRRIGQLRNWRGDRLRTARFQRIVDPGAMPLIAIRLQVMARKSLGGIQTDLGCRVLREPSGAPGGAPHGGSQAGEAIPGLYAVGEAAGFGGGGVHGKRSLEGTFLGGCVFTGRLAAATTHGVLISD